MFGNLMFLYGEARVWEDDNGEHYIDKIFDDVFWERYLSVSEKVTVCFRRASKIVDEAAKAKLKKIDSEKMKIYSLPSITDSLKSFCSVKKRTETLRILINILHECDGMVIRVPSTVGNQAIKLCKRKNIPYLVEVVGDPYASLYYHSSVGKILAPFEALIAKRLVKNASYVLYVSKEYLQKGYPTRGNALSCPDANIEIIDEEAIVKRINKIKAKNYDDPYVLGLIGSLNVDYRGHKTLIKALSLLRADGLNCVVKFLGAGNKKRWEQYALELNVNEYVQFSGTLPGGEPVLKWIDDIDILVMPAKVESLGRAVIEAMTRGCPVLGTSTTAHREQLGSDCICLPDDVQAFYSKIKKIMTNRAYAEYCAYENFYRSHKYMNAMVDPERNAFFKKFMNDTKEG